MSDKQPAAPGYTKSTLYLIGVLGLMTVVFVAAGIAGVDPILDVFKAVALVL